MPPTEIILFTCSSDISFSTTVVPYLALILVGIKLLLFSWRGFPSALTFCIPEAKEHLAFRTDLTSSVSSQLLFIFFVGELSNSVRIEWCNLPVDSSELKWLDSVFSWIDLACSWELAALPFWWFSREILLSKLYLLPTHMLGDSWWIYWTEGVLELWLCLLWLFAGKSCVEGDVWQMNSSLVLSPSGFLEMSQELALEVLEGSALLDGTPALLFVTCSLFL